MIRNKIQEVMDLMCNVNELEFHYVYHEEILSSRVIYFI